MTRETIFVVDDSVASHFRNAIYTMTPLCKASEGVKELNFGSEGR
jgi:hypothetical protein